MSCSALSLATFPFSGMWNAIVTRCPHNSDRQARGLLLLTAGARMPLFGFLPSPFAPSRYLKIKPTEAFIVIYSEFESRDSNRGERLICIACLQLSGDQAAQSVCLLMREMSYFISSMSLVTVSVGMATGPRARHGETGKDSAGDD
ncbi:hypothetical protein AOLI_G00129280 [Acnodon oligacanthus]